MLPAGATRTPPARRALRGPAAAALPWLLPVAVAFAYHSLSERRAQEVVAAALGALLVAVAYRRPGGALVALVVFLPLEQLMSGLALRAGVPARALHLASSFKELMVLSVLIAAALEVRAHPRPLDRVDRLALAYLALVTAYLAAPHLFSATAPTSLSVRLLAWRSDCGYVVVLLAARHAPLGERQRRAVVGAVVAVGALTAGLAVVQKLETAWWTHFVLRGADMVGYFVRVLHQSTGQAYGALAYVYQTRPVRVSSILLNPDDMADYLVLVTAIAAVGVVGGRARKGRWYALLAAALAGVYLSAVRADAVGAGLVLAMALLMRAPLARASSRAGLAAALAVGLVLLAPFLAGSRYLGGNGGGTAAAGHLHEIGFGLSVLYHHPLGLGLGTQPSTSARFADQTGHQPRHLISDNSLLQVGDELGWPAMLAWAALVAAALAETWRRGRGGDTLAAAAALALGGVLAAGMLHHVFLLFPVPWTLWALVGLASGSGHRGGRDELDPQAGAVPTGPEPATAR